jgi:hypothetical protein
LSAVAPAVLAAHSELGLTVWQRAWAKAVRFPHPPTTRGTLAQYQADALREPASVADRRGAG